MSDSIRECRAERVTILEMVMDVCEHDFGEAPCNATGDFCYNTASTCKDSCNYSCTTKSYFFTTCKVPSFLLTSYVPNIESVDISPSTLEIGKTFSTRGQAVINFTDIPHNDLGFDPYLQQRGVIAVCPEDKPGTLLARWKARVKFFENRKAIIYEGFADQPLCEFTKGVYVIDSMIGPNNNGNVTLKLKDPLILADNKNAQCPTNESRIVATQVAGNEFPKPFVLGTALDGLDEDPNDDTESLPYSQVNNYLLQNNYLAGDPKQDAFFTSLRHICIGEEVLAVRGEINNAVPRGWNIVLEDRAVCGSTLSPHKQGASLSAASTFQNIHVADVVLQLLTECSELQDIIISCCSENEPSIFDFASFENFRCTSPLSYVIETIICKSEGATKLIDELSEQFLFTLASDPDTGLITINSFSPPSCSIEPYVFDQCSDIVEDSFSIDGEGDYLNQIEYFHTANDCSKAISKENSAKAEVIVSADVLREPCERREGKATRKKTMISRWITDANRFLAKANGERWLLFRSCPSLEVSFDVLMDLGNCHRLGSYAMINHERLQDVDGGPDLSLYFLKGKAPNDGCVTLTFERTPFDRKISPCLTCDGSCPTLAVSVDDCDDSNCIGVW